MGGCGRCLPPAKKGGAAINNKGGYGNLRSWDGYEIRRGACYYVSISRMV